MSRKPRLIPPMPPRAGRCSFGCGHMVWFEVDKDLFEPNERVSLRQNLECENGPVKTAERLDWDFEPEDA